MRDEKARKRMHNPISKKRVGKNSGGTAKGKAKRKKPGLTARRVAKAKKRHQEKRGEIEAERRKSPGTRGTITLNPVLGSLFRKKVDTSHVEAGRK